MKRAWGQSDRCLVIAHRGDTKKGVENTLPAIQSALRMGVDGVEVDLRMTKDGEVVIFHDDDLKRLAGSDLKIEQTDLATLRTLRVNGVSIPTLEELLDLVKDRALLNLEIKTVHPFRADLEKKLVNLLGSFHLLESILVSSFHPLPLWRLKRIAPQLKRGYLFQSRPFLHERIIPQVSPFSINAPLAYASQSRMMAAHKSGRRFFVWTVNDENDMKRLIAEGADGLITDEPQKLLDLS